MTYLKAIVFTVLAYIAGLFADSNIDFGIDLNLRILFPLIVMGVFLIYIISRNTTHKSDK